MEPLTHVFARRISDDPPGCWQISNIELHEGNHYMGVYFLMTCDDWCARAHITLFSPGSNLLPLSPEHRHRVKTALREVLAPGVVLAGGPVLVEHALGAERPILHLHVQRSTYRGLWSVRNMVQI